MAESNADMQVNVKTLDSLTHPFSVNSNLSIKEFKALIEATVKVEANQQRLIYCGKVLADDKHLSDYDINGKTIHLVVRPPPSASNPVDSSTSGASSNSGRRSAPPGSSSSETNSQFLGAFYVPHQQFDSVNFQQIVQDVISNLGDLGRNATVMSTTSDDGSAVDVHINLGQVSSQNTTNHEVQHRVTQIRSLLSSVNRELIDLEQESVAAPAPAPEITPMDQGDVPPPLIPVPPSSSTTTRTSTEAAMNAAEAAFTAAEGAAAAASAAEAAAHLARQAAAAVAASMYGVGRQQIVAPSIVIRARSPNSTSAPGSASTTSTTTGPVPSSVPRRSTNGSPFTSVEFADLLRSVRDLETRYRQHMISLEDNLRATPTDTQPTTSLIEQGRRHRVLSNIMHEFGHIYYYLSDLFVNFNQPPPRNVGLLSNPSSAFTPNILRPASSTRSSSLPRSGIRVATSSAETRNQQATPAAASTTRVHVAQAPVLVMEVGTTVRIPGVSSRSTASPAATATTTSTEPVAPIQTRPMIPVRIPVAVPVAVPVPAPTSSSSSRNWESSVPPSWLPVINGDLMRQRQSNPSGQPPPQQFSEAYLNGLPKKKRRMEGDDDHSSGGGSRC